MPTATRRQFTDAFRFEAVRLTRESDRPGAQVAGELGISNTVQYRWRSEQQQVESQGRTRQAVRAEQDELTRLKREHEMLRKERDGSQRAAAGSDAWRSRPERTRSATTRTLLSASRLIHRASRATYGSPSIWDALIKQGHHIGAHRVIRLMRIDGIRAKTVTQWRATTQSNHRWPVAEHTLTRQFTVAYPNQV